MICMEKNGILSVKRVKKSAKRTFFGPEKAPKNTSQKNHTPSRDDVTSRYVTGQFPPAPERALDKPFSGFFFSQSVNRESVQRDFYVSL